MTNITFIELIKTTAAFIGATTTIIGFILMLSKQIREVLKRKVQNWSGFHENFHRDEETRKELEYTMINLKKEFNSMRKFFENTLNDLQKELLAMNQKLNRTEDLEKKQLRKIITDTYTQYSAKKHLPYYTHKELVEMYAKYKTEYNGNSYADEIYHIMQEWDVDLHETQRRN